MTEADYALLERFSIMTIDGGLTDQEALARLQQEATPAQIKTLQETINENIHKRTNNR